MILLEDIRYSVNDRLCISVPQAEFGNGKVTVIAGKSGAGKSILLKMLFGEISPQSGRIFFEGKLVHRLYAQQGAIAMLPQDGWIPQGMAVRELFPTRDRSPVVTENLGELWNYRIRSLSSGMQRLVEILYVLGLGRKIVLLDEPLNGLDPRYFSLCRDEITRSDCRVVVASSRIRDYIDICDQIFVVRHGKVFLSRSDMELRKFGLLPLVTTHAD